jgi:hypothetical protein
MRGGRRAVRVAVACVEEGSKGANSAGVEERMTRGGYSSRRWRGDDGRAAARGEALPVVGEQSRGHVREEEEERGGAPGDLFEISRKFKGLSVN